MRIEVIALVFIGFMGYRRGYVDKFGLGSGFSFLLLFELRFGFFSGYVSFFFRGRIIF